MPAVGVAVAVGLAGWIFRGEVKLEAERVGGEAVGAQRGQRAAAAGGLWQENKRTSARPTRYEGNMSTSCRHIMPNAAAPHALRWRFTGAP